MEYLRNGLWKARARKALIRSGPLKNFHGKSEFFKQIARLPGYGEHANCSTFGSGMIERAFWLGAHSSATETWNAEDHFLWWNGARIEIDRSIVESFDGHFLEDLPNDSFLGVHATFFGVEIDPEDVDATSPELPVNSARTARSSTFDWEGAFASVAARLYFDLQFEDVHARGTQVAVVDALREYFQNNNLAIPEISSLKAKARKIVGALRSK